MDVCWFINIYLYLFIHIYVNIYSILTFCFDRFGQSAARTAKLWILKRRHLEMKLQAHWLGVGGTSRYIDAIVPIPKIILNVLNISPISLRSTAPTSYLIFARSSSSSLQSSPVVSCLGRFHVKAESRDIGRMDRDLSSHHHHNCHHHDSDGINE